MALLHYKNRLRIRELLNAGLSPPEIARQIGVHHSTIYSELVRGGGKPESKWAEYDPELSQQISKRNAKKKNNFPEKKSVFAENRSLAEAVSDLVLSDGKSIQQVIAWLKEQPPDRFGPVPSRNTLINAVEKGLIPGVTREDLRIRAVTLFSGDLLHIPAWVVKKTGLRDGDVFSISVTEDEIVLKWKRRP